MKDHIDLCLTMGTYNPQMGTIPKCRVQKSDALHKEKNLGVIYLLIYCFFKEEKWMFARHEPHAKRLYKIETIESYK